MRGSAQESKTPKSGRNEFINAINNTGISHLICQGFGRAGFERPFCGGGAVIMRRTTSDSSAPHAYF